MDSHLPIYSLSLCFCGPFALTLILSLSGFHQPSSNQHQIPYPSGVLEMISSLCYLVWCEEVINVHTAVITIELLYYASQEW